MKLSYHFMFYIICFTSLSINARAHIDPNLISVPLPVFKNSLEKTMEVVQNVASTMSHMHVGEDDQNSTNMYISYCEDLLDSTVEVLNWCLSTIYSRKGDVIFHMRTWLNASQTSQNACVDAFENGIDSKVGERLKQVTRLIGELLGMIQVQQQHHRQPNAEAQAPAPTGDQPPHSLAAAPTGGGQPPYSQKPNLTVSQDGSGNYKKIADAIGAAPSFSKQRFVIFVKKGVYKEYVNIDKTKTNLVLIGEGMHVTIISGDRSNVSGWHTNDSATFAVKAEGFVATDIGFENTAGPNNKQAVALSSGGDRSVFYRCKISGYQDTLLVTLGRQFFRECTISGTIDFIFGYGTAVFQKCKILARKNIKGAPNTLSASGRFAQDPSGFSFQFCNIEADADLAGDPKSTPTYLGRPWGKYSRTVFIKSYLSDVIRPEGWLAWPEKGGTDTLYYAEYMNNGPGASVAGRVKWHGYHVITASSEADQFTVAKFIDGNSWLPSTGIPYAPGLAPV